MFEAAFFALLLVAVVPWMARSYTREVGSETEEERQKRQEW